MSLWEDDKHVSQFSSVTQAITPISLYGAILILFHTVAPQDIKIQGFCFLFVSVVFYFEESSTALTKTDENMLKQTRIIARWRYTI